MKRTLLVMLYFAFAHVQAHAQEPSKTPPLWQNQATPLDQIPTELKFETWGRPSGQNFWDHLILNGGAISYQIGNRSWHEILFRPVQGKRISLGIRITCDSEGGGQVEAIDWKCPDLSNVNDSHYIRRIKLELIGADANKYKISYKCWTDRYQGPGGKWPRERKEYPTVSNGEWYGNEGGTNIWLSQIDVSLTK